MNKSACPFHGGNTGPSIEKGAESSWKDFRKSLLPAADRTEQEGHDSRNRIPPQFVEYMDAIAPYFLQSISGPDLRIPSGILNPRIAAAKTPDGYELYIPNDKLHIQFGARNVDEASYALQEVLIHTLNRVFKDLNVSGFQTDLKNQVMISRSAVVLSLLTPFPVDGGIGTAVDVTLNSFAALLKMAHREGILNEDNKKHIFAYHAAVVHGLALMDIDSLGVFSEAIVAKPKPPELFEYQQSVIHHPLNQLIPSEAETGDPWDTGHFFISRDDVGGIKLEIDPKFSRLDLIKMKSPVAKPAGCPYRKNIPPLVKKIMELAWEVVAMPMMRGEIKDN